MIVRIGIADTGREVEVSVDNRDEFVDSIEKAFASDTPVVWLTDIKGNDVGIPTARIGYIEIAGDSGPSVGFSR